MEVYDEIVRTSGDAIVEVARRRTIDAEFVASRMGWTHQAATAVLRRLVKAGRLNRSQSMRTAWRSGASLAGYQVGRVTYWASRESS